VPTDDIRSAHTDTRQEKSLSEEAWDTIDKAVRRLEKAWQAQAPTRHRPLVPPPSDPLSLAGAGRIDQSRQETTLVSGHDN